MAHKKAIFAGSFDPITNGHLGVLGQAFHIFDEVIIALATNHSKKYTFERDERLELLSDALYPFSLSHGKTILNISRVETGNKSIALFARQAGACALIRSYRTVKDYEEELLLQRQNARIAPEIPTIYFPPPADFPDTSSSLVRALMETDDAYMFAAHHVPQVVYQALLKKYHKGEFAVDPSRESY